MFIDREIKLWERYKLLEERKQSFFWLLQHCSIGAEIQDIIYTLTQHWPGTFCTLLSICCEVSSVLMLSCVFRLQSWPFSYFISNKAERLLCECWFNVDFYSNFAGILIKISYFVRHHKSYSPVTVGRHQGYYQGLAGNSWNLTLRLILDFLLVEPTLLAGGWQGTFHPSLYFQFTVKWSL